MHIENSSRKVADRILLLIVGLITVAYITTSWTGVSNQFGSGHWVSLLAAIISIAAVISVAAKFFMPLRWDDAASLALDEVCYLGFSAGVFLGARDALGLHWIIALLLTIPGLAMAFGQLRIYSRRTPAALAAKAATLQLVSGIEPGRVYDGKIEKLMKFGAFIVLAPGVRGLLHFSQMSDDRTRNSAHGLKEGEIVKVKVLEVDTNGHVRLTMKSVV